MTTAGPQPTSERAEVLGHARIAARGYFRLDLKAPRIAGSVGPGQFVMVRCGPGPAPLLRRPISVASVDGERISLVVKTVGPGTQWMESRAVGDPVELIGPLGNRFSLPGSGELLLVGGGIGVPPMLALAEELQRRGFGGAVRAFVGGRTSGDLVLVDELEAAGAEVICTTEDGSAGEAGQVTGPVAARLAAGADDTRICACGPQGMLRAVARLASEHDVPCEVSLEAHMACGLGACLGCAVTAADNSLVHVCSDGPVFDSARIFGGRG